jgi:hypothetical protein
VAEPTPGVHRDGGPGGNHYGNVVQAARAPYSPSASKPSGLGFGTPIVGKGILSVRKNRANWDDAGPWRCGRSICQRLGSTLRSISVREGDEVGGSVAGPDLAGHAAVGGVHRGEQVHSAAHRCQPWLRHSGTPGIIGTTAHPMNDWATQQIYKLLMDLDGAVDRIKFLIRDRDILYPPTFDAVLAGAGIRTVRSAVRTPGTNSIMERWIGGCRRELLDRTLVWSLPHLRRVLSDYEQHYNAHRPHMALHSAAQDKPLPPEVIDLQAFRTRRHDRIGGLEAPRQGWIGDRRR